MHAYRGDFLSCLLQHCFSPRQSVYDRGILLGISANTDVHGAAARLKGRKEVEEGDVEVRTMVLIYQSVYSSVESLVLRVNANCKSSVSPTLSVDGGDDATY